jgi:hypothetical protein
MLRMPAFLIFLESLFFVSQDLPAMPCWLSTHSILRNFFVD